MDLRDHSVSSCTALFSDLVNSAAARALCPIESHIRDLMKLTRQLHDGGC